MQPLRRPHDRSLVCGAQVLRLKNLGLPLKGPFYGRGERGLLGSARQTRSHMVPAPRSASAPPWIFRGAEEAASASRGAPQPASEASAFGLEPARKCADAAAEPISTGNGSSEGPAPQVPQRRDHRLVGSMDCTRCASSGLIRGRERPQLQDCPRCNGRGIVPVYVVGHSIRAQYQHDHPHRCGRHRRADEPARMARLRIGSSEGRWCPEPCDQEGCPYLCAEHPNLRLPSARSGAS